MAKPGMRFIQFRLIGPAIVGLGLLIAGMAAIPYYGVAEIDAGVKQKQETLVARNISLWITDIEFSLTAWTVWDEAIAKIDNAYDFEWTDRNIGASLIGTSRTRFVAVLKPDDSILYSRIDDTVKDKPFFARGADAIINDSSAMIGEVRAREPSQEKTGIPKPLSVSRIEVLGNEAVLLTASLFQPDFRTSEPKSNRAPVLVTAMPIAGSLPEFFGTRFLLDDARVGPLSETTPDRARAEIAVGAKGEVQVLSWRTPTPAADVLWRALPLAVTVGIVLMAGGFFLIRMSRTAAKVLLSRERQMRHAATHDFLTGLANRARLEPEFDTLVNKGALTVACLDLDGFKEVNDTYGHAIGDELLKAVASRLRAGTASSDRLFRLGGDEFAIMIPGQSLLDAQRACRRLSLQLAKPYSLSAGEVSIAASFGLAHVAGPETACDTALGAADTALYAAKLLDLGSVVTTEEMQQPSPAPSRSRRSSERRCA
ncbi:sensor domain-containing diguanylate cyclase [Neorhizobium alkalisoli]|uniref:Diguanylate cyclase (GGDEF)-like protein n=1 Tax=Neorhizobium alkalisoli TaxID=528178 RepID=A0A561R6N8_9HYPH|nr:diguanylate cyclase [Neorhizobium alkalisoli]TWF58276.1 diguanylate cyclase (GGDEF)-like protein [Neorhizobium alkalisoli]